MDWLNYHHLRYFFVTAREGSIAKASRVLHTSPPAISTQIRQLEQRLGERLFERRGRGLHVTEVGRLVFAHAEQIFQLGRELLDTVRDRPSGQPQRMQVGVADVVPKALAFRLLEPLVAHEPRVRIVVQEDRPERLLVALANFELDLVIADAAAPASRSKVFSHPFGECAVGVFAVAKAARRLAAGFPASLAGQRCVLPLPGSELRRAFDAFLDRSRLPVDITAELEDEALARAFAAGGHGLLLAPVVLAADLRRDGLRQVGELPEVRCRYHAITVERRVRHPAVVRLLQAARSNLFANG